ncbi:unnamed protein product, partial [Mycena citricolor]
WLSLLSNIFFGIVHRRSSVRTWVESCFARPNNSVPVTLLISLSYVLLALYNVSKYLIRCTISSLFHSRRLVGTLQSNLVQLLPTFLRHTVAPPVDVTRSPSPFLFLKLSSWQGARCSAGHSIGNGTCTDRVDSRGWRTRDPAHAFKPPPHRSRNARQRRHTRTLAGAQSLVTRTAQEAGIRPRRSLRCTIRTGCTTPTVWMGGHSRGGRRGASRLGGSWGRSLKWAASAHTATAKTQGFRPGVLLALIAPLLVSRGTLEAFIHRP